MSCDSDCEEISVAFRSLIIKIVHLKLDMDTLEEFKYMCRDRIGPGSLENIKTFLDLFLIMEERDIISPANPNFLLHCLSVLHHKVAAQLVYDYIEEWIASKTITEDKYKRFCNDGSKCKTEMVQDSFQQHTSEQTPITAFNEEGERQDKAVPFVEDDSSSSYYTSNTPLTRSQDNFVSYMATKLASNNWQATMRYLGIDEDIINAANYTWPHDLRRKIRETLEYWIRSGGAITKESAMAATTLAGREDLAQELNDKFPYI